MDDLKFGREYIATNRFILINFLARPIQWDFAVYIGFRTFPLAAFLKFSCGGINNLVLLDAVGDFFVLININPRNIPKETSENFFINFNITFDKHFSEFFWIISRLLQKRVVVMINGGFKHLARIGGSAFRSNVADTTAWRNAFCLYHCIAFT